MGETKADDASARQRWEALDVELRASLLRALMQAWREINVAHFKGALTPPALQLSPPEERLADGGARHGSAALGCWRADRRTIELSAELVLRQPWGVVLEVLKHEMAHQYVHEVLGATDETAHGPAFRQVCERLGIDARAAGLPDADAVDEDPRRVRLRTRVEGLLALAQSPNRHEAENAAALAQRLILKHNIALAELPGRRRYNYRHLGQPKGRHAEAEHLIATILGRHFFVETIWVPSYRPQDGKHVTVLEVCGTPENLALAAYVHAFLLETGERLWREHKRERGIRKNRDRRRFIAGVMEGFAERLSAEKRKNAEQGLVWVGDPELGSYLRRRHPYVRSVSRQGAAPDAARREGRAAGRNIVLRRGVGEGQQTGDRGRALPPVRRR
ncbi:MAG: DUF2786 domain-containing protein [Myxococcota bacterium]